VHGIIFAGGKSSRMGEDKARMFDNVARLQMVFSSIGIEQTVVLCGVESRANLFSGTILSDPEEDMGLHMLVQWLQQSIQDDIVCVPCDAYTLTQDGVQLMLGHAKAGGVIVQENKIHPTFCIIPKGWQGSKNATSLTSLLKDLPHIEVDAKNDEFLNFNSRKDLGPYLAKINRLHQEFLHLQSS